jgi:hypothetical protein
MRRRSIVAAAAMAAAVGVAPALVPALPSASRGLRERLGASVTRR